jgi:hypothetical protein
MPTGQFSWFGQIPRVWSPATVTPSCFGEIPQILLAHKTDDQKIHTRIVKIPPQNTIWSSFLTTYIFSEFLRESHTEHRICLPISYCSNATEGFVTNFLRRQHSIAICHSPQRKTIYTRESAPSYLHTSSEIVALCILCD